MDKKSANGVFCGFSAEKQGNPGKTGYPGKPKITFNNIKINFSGNIGLGMELAALKTVKKVFIKKSPGFPPAADRIPGPAANFFTANTSAVKSEITRKLLHFLIALGPGIASCNYRLSLAVLTAGIICYTIMESLRIAGINIPFVSALTKTASREKETGHFVFGPVTLGVGALFALLLFPPQAAAIGIYALAFGDGFAGLAGTLFGITRPVFLRGKSIEGSAACFAAVFFTAWFVSKDLLISLAASCTAVIAEALPLEDLDNIVLPLAVCAAVQVLM